MKAQIQNLVQHALDRLVEDGLLPANVPGAPAIERARDPAHGDFASNVAMVLAKGAGVPPRELARRVVGALPATAWLERVEIAGPGRAGCSRTVARARGPTPPHRGRRPGRAGS